jgi:hypothetical protein
MFCSVPCRQVTDAGAVATARAGDSRVTTCA